MNAFLKLNSLRSTHWVSQRGVLAVSKVALIALLSTSVVAEARLIRGGGRGSNSVITDASFAGTVPFLVPDENVDANQKDTGGVLGLEVIETFGATGADLTDAAAYGYGPIGVAASISHDWGRDCALNTECFFELGASEFLDWSGRIVGLPEELVGGESYLAVADLVITWELFAIEALPEGFFTTGPLPSRSLGSEFVWSSRFAANADGSYEGGVGSAAVGLGESLGYAPASDELSGCFAPRPAGPPVLPLAEAYSRGDCRTTSLDLGEEFTAPTGADLAAELLEREFLGLIVTAEFIAPAGFQFANLREFGGIDPEDALLPGAEGLPTPESIRGLASIEYRGCAARPDSDCTLFATSSDILRINVVDDARAVPAPASVWLLMLGAVVGCRRRRKRS